jgi:hypothetical protein
MHEFDLKIKQWTRPKHVNVYFQSKLSTNDGEISENDDFLDLLIINVQE